MGGQIGGKDSAKIDDDALFVGIGVGTIVAFSRVGLKLTLGDREDGASDGKADSNDADGAFDGGWESRMAGIRVGAIGHTSIGGGPKSL